MERIALRLIRRWRADGVDAPLFMGRADGPMRADVGQDIAYTMPRQPPFATGWWETLWMIATLPRTIRRTRPDILFCAGNSYAVVAVAMKLRFRRACPPVVAKISNDLDRMDMPAPIRVIYRCWLRIQGRFIDHFIGMEMPMMQEIAQAMRVDQSRITIVPDPALSEAMIASLRTVIERDRRTGGGRHFVAVGRLAPQKNFPLMLRAFAKARIEGDTLTLFGEGPERRKLETMIRDLGMEAHVSLPGHVPDPASRLPDYDIFLLSSDYEGVPAVILEALAANLAIVATRCSRSMESLLSGGALGQLTSPGDEQDFARAIAASRPGTQDEQASLAQAHRFTLERAARAYRDCFAAVAKDFASAN